MKAFATTLLSLVIMGFAGTLQAATLSQADSHTSPNFSYEKNEVFYDIDLEDRFADIDELDSGLLGSKKRRRPNGLGRLLFCVFVEKIIGAVCDSVIQEGEDMQFCQDAVYDYCAEKHPSGNWQFVLCNTAGEVACDICLGE